MSESFLKEKFLEDLINNDVLSFNEVPNIEEVEFRELTSKISLMGFLPLNERKEMNNYELDMYKIFKYQIINDFSYDLAYLSLGNLFYIKAISYTLILKDNIKDNFDYISNLYIYSLLSIFQSYVCSSEEYRTKKEKILIDFIKNYLGFIFKYGLKYNYITDDVLNKESFGRFFKGWCYEYYDYFFDILGDKIKNIFVSSYYYSKYEKLTTILESINFFEELKIKGDKNIPTGILKETIFRKDKYDILFGEEFLISNLENCFKGDLKYLEDNKERFSGEIYTINSITLRSNRLNKLYKYISLGERHNETLLIIDFIEKIILEYGDELSEETLKYIHIQQNFYKMNLDYIQFLLYIENKEFGKIQEFIDYGITMHDRFEDEEFIGDFDHESYRLNSIQQVKLKLLLASKFFRNKFSKEDFNFMEKIKPFAMKHYYIRLLYNLILGKFCLKYTGINIDNPGDLIVLQQKVEGFDDVLLNVFSWIFIQNKNENTGLWNSSIDEEVKKLIYLPESDNLEFKSSLRYDIERKLVNKELEFAVLKVIASFLNTKGGDLFIGISDQHNILGIENDYQTIGKKGWDGFDLYITDLIKRGLGDDIFGYLTIECMSIGKKDVCRISVQKSKRPVYLMDRAKNVDKFYIRKSAKSEEITSRKVMMDYILDTFEKVIGQEPTLSQFDIL